MNLIFRVIYLMFIASLSMSFSSCSNREAADLLIRGGRIYTMAANESKVEAVAVKDEKIVYAGSVAGSEQFIGPKTHILELEGKTVLPGLIDSHAHLHSLGKFLSELILTGTTSSEQIREMVQNEIANASPGTWISGRGWDQNDWEVKQFPTWQDLAGTETNPVYLRRVDGHAAWVNLTALELCGISGTTPDPDGGKIIRDDSGDPTGIFIDKAIDLIKAKIPKPDREERIKRIKKAILKCHSVGLVGIHDASVDSITLDILLDLNRRDELPIRIYSILDLEDNEGNKAERFIWDWFDRGQYFSDDGYLTVRSVKLYADGALGSRGAALLQPYTDDPNNSGLIIDSLDYIYDVAKRALKSGFQVCTHAIGDAGNRIVLDAYEKALTEIPLYDHRFRIEHCQVLSPSDISRFSESGIIPSMQPTHATSDMYWAEDRLGPERVRGAYAWRKLLDSGCRIPCGSDFPVETPDPLWGIYAAVTRQDHAGWPVEGWYAEQCMTIEEAVRGFTIDAAYAEFAEDVKGSIEVGKLADFTVLDKDIFEIPPGEILDTKVTHTIVGGKIVYTSN